nr:apolipophorins [Megalopta genalis]
MGQPPRLMGTALACLFLLFAAADASSKCSTGCRGMHSNKAYQEGKTYIYQLKGKSVTSVSEAEGDATLELSATVELSVKPDCVHQLVLKNVLVNKERPNTPGLEDATVQFNYHNGHIDTEICAEPTDSQASLNIKRAVVSLFQSAVLQDSGTAAIHETDVMGVCPTKFSFYKKGETLVVEKTRNLDQCSFRENVNQGLVTAMVDTATGLKTTPLLDSHQTINQRFKQGVLDSATSTETYKLRPFSNGESGAKTVVETTLSFTGEKPENPTKPVSAPKTLIFDAPHAVVKYNQEDIAKALKAAQAEIAGGVKPAAASKFTELVKVLRLSNKPDMLSTYQKVKAGAGFDKGCLQLLLDGLFHAGTGEAAEVGVELIKNKEMTETQTLLFYTGLALIRHTTLPTVTALTTLLDQPDLPRIGYLGIGQAIGKYCQQHSCENVAKVKEAVHKIREKVGNGKTKTRAQEDVVISALKALGNTFLDDATLVKLANIAADKNVRNRVRVAAIEALPTKCTMKWKNIVLKVFADKEEDSEIRIKSYLSLVACPCPHVASHLKDTLDKETVNQVGSFIQGHLRNLRASTDPNKLNAKSHIGQIKPRTKFPEDFRKFSYNDELSYKIESLGLGTSVDENVIYSQNSYVPRSVDLNVTVELFGRNMNLLSLSTRAENLDRAIEHWLGPKGELKLHETVEDPSDTIQTFKQMTKYTAAKYERLIRGKRAAVEQQELNRFAKNVRLRGNEVDQNLDLDFSMKLFGVEVAYLSYESDNVVDPMKVVVDQVFDKLGRGFEQAKNLNHEVESFLQFLEADLIYPTNLGSSLSLGVTGTSAARVKSNGKVDLADILEFPKKATFRVGVEPSVAVTVTGNILVQALGVESGLKVVSTLHTSTSSDLSVSVLGGTGIDVSLSLPKKKQEVINVNSEVLFSSGPHGEYAAPKFSKGREYKDCFDQLSTVLGLTVCGELSFPYTDLATVQQKPVFPLSGPAKFAVSVENNDVTEFHFRAKLDVENPERRSFEILLDTPKSRTQRRVALTGEVNTKPNLSAKLAFDSPIKKASIEAALKNTPEERSMTVTALHDQNDYYARVGMLVSGNKYKPVLEYKMPEHIARLAGMKPDSQSGQQYTCQGTVEVAEVDGGQKFTIDDVALLIGGQKIVVVDGSIKWTPMAVNVDTKIGYGEKHLDLKMDGSMVPHSLWMLAVTAKPSSDPNLGFSLDWQLKKEKSVWMHNLVFVHGPDLKSEVNRLSLEQKFHPRELEVKDGERSSYKRFGVSLFNELKYPATNLFLGLNGEVDRDSATIGARMTYEKFKTNFGMSLRRSPHLNPGNYELEVTAELLDNKFQLKSKRDVIEPTKSKFTNLLVFTPGGRYESEVTVVYNVNKENALVQVNGDANLNGKKVKVSTDLEANPQLLNSLVFVKVDGVKYIEFTLKTRKSPHPSGTVNLNLKGYLTANGQYSYQNGKGNANLNIDVPKIGRKVQATGQVSVNGPQHDGTLEILYDAKKDPNKRIKLSTNNHIVSNTDDANNHAVSNSIDTKNVLVWLDQKLEVNGKGKLASRFNNVELDLTADVTLPSGRNFNTKLYRISTHGDKLTEVMVNAELQHCQEKGGPATKLQYRANLQLAEPDLTFDSDTQLKLIDTENKDLLINYHIVRKLENGKMLSSIGVKVGGAKVPQEFKVKASSDEDDSCSENKLHGSWGDWLVENNLKIVNKDSDQGLELEGSGKLACGKDNEIGLKLSSKTERRGSLDAASEGKGEFVLKVAKHPPLQLEGCYKYEPSEGKSTADVDVKFEYGDNKATLQSNNVYKPDVAIVTVKVNSALPIEKFRNVALDLDYKRLKADNQLTTNAVLKADGAEYTLKSNIQPQGARRVFEVTTTCPQGKSELLWAFEKLGLKEYKGELTVRTPKGFVTGDVHADLDSVDEFEITGNFDSDKTKYRKVHAEISNKPTAKTGKRIIVTVTSDGKNIVTGSTSYKKRDEEGKIVVEGNGSLKVGDDTKSSSFKYTRQQLTIEKDGEEGIAVILNANFGPSAIVGELKLTNKELHVFNSYCEQTKDCAHFKLQSSMDTTPGKQYLKHQLTVEVDLKKFNVPAEFGLKTNTELSHPQVDHTSNLYLHSTKDKSEYTYQFYIHPKESASILTLPSREVALILVHVVPKAKAGGPYMLDLSLYMDKKNKPAEKTCLSANGDLNIDKDGLSLSGNAKFSYPTQTKDLSVKGRLHSGDERLLDASLDLDVFDKKSQKISITAIVQKQKVLDGQNVTSNIEVNSRGQQLKVNLKSALAFSSQQIELSSFFTYNDVHQKPKTLGALLSADKGQAELFVTLPDKVLIKDEWKYQISKEQQTISRELCLLGEPAIVAKLESKGLNSFDFVTYCKDKPNDKVTVNGQVVLGQLAEIHADSYKDGAKKKLFRVLVHLDEKQFLKPDISYDKANVIEVFEVQKNRRIELVQKLKETQDWVADQIRAETGDLTQHLQKAQPNLKPLFEYYQNELTKLKQEINADETVKEIQATFNKYLGGVVGAASHILKDVAEVTEKLQKQLNTLLDSFKASVNAVYPKLKESYQNIFNKYLEIVDVIANLTRTYLNALLDLINSHQKELHDVLSIVSTMVHDYSKAQSKILEQVTHDLNGFTSELVDKIKALPIYEIAKEKYQNLKNFQVPEAILKSLEEACSVVKNLLPTQELQQLAQVFCKYLTKLVKHETIDPMDAMKEISAKAQNAIKSLLYIVTHIGASEDVLGSLKFQSPFNFGFLSEIPTIPIAQLSTWNLLRNKELPTLMDLYYAYRPTLYLSDIIPPFSKAGVVTDGGHFFTFDGRHLTLPGTCSYILAQDMQDGNFSVVANFNHGSLASLSITAPEESMTLKSNGNILVNNKRADFPASTENLHAYLEYPFGSVKSDYGVRITCTRKAPMVCAVRVSGFYHGRMRGLLGDGNNEPYDDFTLPSGKIAESGTDFGNAYKLKGDCPAATAVEHKDRAPVCTDYFIGQSSTLKSCFKYVNPSQYREACDHAVAADPAYGACLIATAYHYACYSAGIKTTSVPPPCANCQVGASTIGIGDTFSVKIPKKEADIVIVLEQSLPNDQVYKDVITHLITLVRDELKQAGIPDVHIGLIGYAENMPWPQHYTFNGETNITGELKNIKFRGTDPKASFQEVVNGLRELRNSMGPIMLPLMYAKQRLDVELGTLKLTDAHEEAIGYPFRPGAAKAVVGVHAFACEKSPLPISLQHIRLMLGLKTYRDLGLTYYHMSYPTGYDQDKAYSVDDRNNNLASEKGDVCADFAVSSGGAAFNLDNLAHASPKQKKQFAQVVAKKIAAGLIHTELEEDCLCGYQYGIVGRAKCKIVGSKNLARDTKAGVKG